MNALYGAIHDDHRFKVLARVSHEIQMPFHDPWKPQYVQAFSRYESRDVSDNVMERAKGMLPGGIRPSTDGEWHLAPHPSLLPRFRAPDDTSSPSITMLATLLAVVAAIGGVAGQNSISIITPCVTCRYLVPTGIFSQQS